MRLLVSLWSGSQTRSRCASRKPWFVGRSFQASKRAIVVGAPTVNASSPVPRSSMKAASTRLAVVREDLDEVLVDEDAQLHVLALGQIGHGERRLGRADPQRAGLRPEHDRQPAALAIREQGEAEQLSRGLGRGGR